MSWLHCRSCGSRERRSDLAMMMMTQKKLLVSGIRWQVGRRRKGKPSSSLFGQIFFYGYMSSAKTVYQATSSGFFQNCLGNWAVHLESSFLSSASPVTDWAWPIVVPWDQTSFQRHQTITSRPESSCGLALLIHREVQCECNFPTAAACLTTQSHRVHPGSERSVRRKRGKS